MGAPIMMKSTVDACRGSSGNCHANRENTTPNSSAYVVFVR